MGNLSPDWSMRKDFIDFAQLDREETLLVARVEEMALGAVRGRSRFSFFFNERQQMLAQEVIRRKRLEGCLFYGGYPDAVRRMFGAFPDWEQPEGGAFPICAVTIWLPKEAQPSHRDVLGSLMALQIGRECVGDILLEDRRCDVFVQDQLAPLLTGELKKIGRFGVRCETGVPGEYVRAEHFRELRGTVSSARMDALVSVLTGLARQKSATLIRSGLVQCNYQVLSSCSGEFFPGDVFTIRGYGKYKVDEIGKLTKKGRLPVVCRKYQ